MLLPKSEPAVQVPGVHISQKFLRNLTVGNVWLIYEITSLHKIIQMTNRLHHKKKGGAKSRVFSGFWVFFNI